MENRPRRRREESQSSRTVLDDIRRLTVDIHPRSKRAAHSSHAQERIIAGPLFDMACDGWTIDGDEMETAWPKMSWWNRLWTVWRLRKSVRELHRIPIPRPNVPGPFDSTGKALACSGYYFTETGAGTFRIVQRHGRLVRPSPLLPPRRSAYELREFRTTFVSHVRHFPSSCPMSYGP